MWLTTNQSDRVQILRGLAIIAVVFIHNTPSGLAQVWCRPFLNFSVGLFLFLSGMFSDARKWDPKKRIMKVMIPYIIWTFIYTVLHNFKTPQTIPIYYVKALLTANSAAVMYYVFVYCEFTLLIPLIDYLSRSRYKYLGFAIAPIEIICMRLIPLLLGYDLNPYVLILRDNSCLGWFSYFYLGYLLGNNIVQPRRKINELILIWGVIALQMLEGYWYYNMGDANCGTQLKLSAILSGMVFCAAAFCFIKTDSATRLRFLHFLGDNSFGIYFSHLAVQSVLHHLPYYATYITYPFNAIVTVTISLLCVLVGKRVLGKYSKYLAL